MNKGLKKIEKSRMLRISWTEHVTNVEEKEHHGNC